MKPQPWFEKAVKELDPFLELVPRQREGVFVLARRSKRGLKWTDIEIPWNRQDETMLTHLRRCDARKEEEIAKLAAENYLKRTEKNRDAQRQANDKARERGLDVGRKLLFNPTYQSTPRIGDKLDGESNGTGAS